MSVAIQRCPRCGNENRSDSYACSFCGKRLRVETIERIPIFKRTEREWINPYPWYLKILYLYIDPRKAFWDINHLRKKSPGNLILLFSSLIYGLIGLAFFYHVDINSINGLPPNLIWVFYYHLSFFLAFFLFGFVYQFLLFRILIWLYTKAANYSVGFTERLEARFGISTQPVEDYEDRNLSPFSIYKGGTLLQKQQAYKTKMMLCAFAPFLLINFIKYLVVLIGTPTVSVNIGGLFDPTIFEVMMGSPIWAALDIIDGITLAAWIPILITLSIRELSNSSTFRVLVPTYIISIILAILIFFIRPSIVG
ncbi:MAG: hypothetical protein GF317_21570|nr:hypothetical protein [Candidatus Lokiarchaeota archaeon]MBD3202052.1 hypothetical protein [Candidatus Lokiarchaeota archaeon]